jgi:hypothetical protein
MLAEQIKLPSEPALSFEQPEVLEFITQEWQLGKPIDITWLMGTRTTLLPEEPWMTLNIRQAEIFGDQGQAIGYLNVKRTEVESDRPPYCYSLIGMNSSERRGAERGYGLRLLFLTELICRQLAVQEGKPVLRTASILPDLPMHKLFYGSEQGFLKMCEFLQWSYAFPPNSGGVVKPIPFQIHTPDGQRLLPVAQECIYEDIESIYLQASQASRI